MARYLILETAVRGGEEARRVVYPGDGDGNLTNLDEAHARMSELRAKARKSKLKYEDGEAQGQPVNYVVVRVKDVEEGNVSKSGGATSVRLQEPTRKRLARIVGYQMWKTGENVSLGDAIDALLDFHERWADRVEELEGAGT